MGDVEFNLLYEKWIAVMTLQGETKEVSLLEALEHAHRYRSLAGELPTQDVAILRLLLAILYATFGRVDVDGKQAPIVEDGSADGGRMALERWQKLWDRHSLPIEPISKRLEFYKERFYLIHPDRPFYQVASFKNENDGKRAYTSFPSGKLLGDLVDSNHDAKVPFFAMRFGRARALIPYNEAARWLIHLQGFDDSASKETAASKAGNLHKKRRDQTSPSKAWLGKLGVVYAEGDNLFETLLLNFVLLNEDKETWCFDNVRAAWELDEARASERDCIGVPTNPLELLTLQSRRIRLKREGSAISGYDLIVGDYFSEHNAIIEQMTIWDEESSSKAKTSPRILIPKAHDKARQMWRELPSLLVGKENERSRLPGIISWQNKLISKGILSKKVLELRIAGTVYDKNGNAGLGVISDSLSMSANLLLTSHSSWVNLIIELLDKTDKCIKKLGEFASVVYKSRYHGKQAGSDKEEEGKNIGQRICERAYFELDMPFRKWLASINPTSSNASEKQNEWIGQTRQLILHIADDVVDKEGDRVYIGTYEKQHGKPINAFVAFNELKRSVNVLMPTQTRRESDE
jgi:CRISPR system Cascade subunit CasA